MYLKICGITTEEDAQLCEMAGADLLGFIFHPESPRYISPEEVSSIRTRDAKRVGVFVKCPLQEIEDIAEKASLDLLQLHGAFPREICRDLGPSRVIKVMWPERYESPSEFLAEVERYIPFCGYLLFDAGKEGGGHGRAIGTRALSYLSLLPPWVRWILAGGICVENIEEIVSLVRPWGLDVNSCVEEYPGKKDKDRVIAISKKIKEMK